MKCIHMRQRGRCSIKPGVWSRVINGIYLFLNPTSHPNTSGIPNYLREGFIVIMQSLQRLEGTSLGLGRLAEDSKGRFSSFFVVVSLDPQRLMQRLDTPDVSYSCERMTSADTASINPLSHKPHDPSKSSNGFTTWHRTGICVRLELI